LAQRQRCSFGNLAIMGRAEGDLVSGEELARWLGLSGKEIYDLAKADILLRVALTDWRKAFAVTANICAGQRQTKTVQLSTPSRKHADRCLRRRASTPPSPDDQRSIMTPL
jgi:hypothetical protein